MDSIDIFSGIQPSGNMTLGNYLGAMANHVKLSAQSKALFCVVDLHALTVRQDPQGLRRRSLEVAAWYLACGLDTSHSSLFIQSHVPEHTELAWVLSTFTMMGELERMTQFKEKALRHKHNINAGLFTYPTLMAADILLYGTPKVPVGEDQKQHLELARDIALRFNNAYDTGVLVVPEPEIPTVAARIMDLQNPTGKMSKSVESGGTIFLQDDEATMRKKVMRAVTDTENHIAYDRVKQPGLANLFEIYGAFTGKNPKTLAADFSGKGYGDLKKAVAEVMLETLLPIQRRFNELMSDEAELLRLLHAGAQKARALAAPRLEHVKRLVGLVV